IAMRGGGRILPQIIREVITQKRTRGGPQEMNAEECRDKKIADADLPSEVTGHYHALFIDMAIHGQHNALWEIAAQLAEGNERQSKTAELYRQLAAGAIREGDARGFVDPLKETDAAVAHREFMQALSVLLQRATIAVRFLATASHVVLIDDIHGH